MRFRRRIKMGGDGTLTVSLNADERALIRSVANELTVQLESPSDPSLRRLFPPGYGDDTVREAGYQMMMGDELRQRQIAALRELTETAEAQRIDAATAASWLQSINAIRLVLGTRLGVTEDTQPFRLHRGDPDAPTWVAYDFLSLLLDELVSALSF